MDVQRKKISLPVSRSVVITIGLGIFWLLLYNAFVADATDFPEMRYALFLNLFVLTFGFQVAFFTKRLNIYALSGIAPITHFALPKIGIITNQPDLITEWAPTTLTAIHTLSVIWLSIGVLFYLILWVLKKFNPSPFKHKQEFELFVVRDSVWLTSLGLYIFLMILPMTALGAAVRAAAVAALLCSHPVKLKKLYFPAALVALCFSVYEFISTGFILTCFATVGLIFLTSLSLRKWVLLGFSSLAMVILSYLQVVKYDYREIITYNPTLTIYEKVEIVKFGLTAALVSTLSDSEDEVSSPGIDGQSAEGLAFRMVGSNFLSRSFLQRMHDDSFERVLDYTPRRVPFWGEQTLQMAIFSFIPRLIWPDKPKKDGGHKFGVLYGYLGDDDLSTSVGFNIFAEGYMAWGYPSLALVSFCFLLALLFCDMCIRIILGKQALFSTLCYSSIFINFHLQLSSIVSNVVYVTIGLLLFRRMFQKVLNPQDIVYDPYLDKEDPNTIERMYDVNADQSLIRPRAQNE